MSTQSSPISQRALQRAKTHSLSRRQFLRGLGTCLALPAFESIGGTRLFAQAARGPAVPATTASGAPLRTAFVYFPNGAIPTQWWPEGNGAEFELNRTLKPLESHRSRIQVVGGLEHLNATPGPDGAGDHARANGTFLTGVRLRKSATDVRAGISIDQVMAQHIGHVTRFPSLELTCDNARTTGACDSGYACAYQYNISWSSATTPMTAESNPRLVFERLFGAGQPGQRAESLRRRRQEQRSILDVITEDARAMQRRMSRCDQDKLDQYLTGVREVEARIQKAELFGDPPDPAVPTPEGIPQSYGEHIQLMYDMMVLAFQTDSTRICTFLLAHDGSNRSFAEIGIPEGHHDLSHHFNDEMKIQKVADIDLWYVEQFARFLDKLERTQDVDGQSLLHNSMIVYGGGNADGNKHTHSNLPVVLAGSGGGALSPGRYVPHAPNPTTNLFLSLADRMSVPNLERFGDSTGRLANI